MCLNLSKIQLFDNFNFKKSHLINGFDIIGDIAIVKINSTNRSQQFKIGHKILSQFSNINSVFLQQGRIFGWKNNKNSQTCCSCSANMFVFDKQYRLRYVAGACI